MKTLKQQIKAYKFDWVNSDIEQNFKAESVREGMKVFHFNQYVSSEEAIAKMKKEGYLPANLSELLTYAKNEWDGKDLVVALGSVAELDGSRRVPFLHRYASERVLSLYWFDNGWGPVCRFLVVPSTQSLEPKSSSSLTLEPLDARMKKLEARMKKLESLINPELLK